MAPELVGRGTGQFMPGLAVDNQGQVGVCFYDHRGDTLNFLIDRRCARSSDAGQHWVNPCDQVNLIPFPSLTNPDVRANRF
jgi:hypothetical protein